MNKNKRIAIAYETLNIMETGGYQNNRNESVDIAAALQHAIANTIHYRPEDFTTVFAQRDQQLKGATTYNTNITVTRETTFAAARRLIVGEGITDVCCLNFASAKNPGGGFLAVAYSEIVPPG